MSLSTCVPTCNAFICGCYLLILFLQHQIAGMQVVDQRIRKEVWDLTHATADTPSADLTDLKLFVDDTTKPNLTPTPITGVKARLAAFMHLKNAEMLDVNLAYIQREINRIDTIVSENMHRQYKKFFHERLSRERKSFVRVHTISAVNHFTVMRKAALEID